MSVILDQFGRPIESLSKPDKSRIFKASLNDRWSDYPSQGLTPQKLAAIFKEADQGIVHRQVELFEEMEEKDTHLSGELLKRKNALLGVDFDILPYEEGARGGTKSSKSKSDMVTDFCRDVIFSLTQFEDSLFELLDAIGKGFAMCEILWEMDGKRAVASGFEAIPQKRLTWADSLTPRLITEDALEGMEIPAFQTVYHRHKARSGHDTRAGMVRVCSWMYLFKNYAIKDWSVFAETYGMPLRLGKYDVGASKEDKEALAAAIQALGSDAAGIISKATDIEFVEAQKYGSINVYSGLATFCNREMSKAIIGATLTTEVGEKGSFAAAKVHDGVRLDLVRSDARLLGNTIREQILRPLVGFNFGWDTPAPWFRFQVEEAEDLAALINVYDKAIRFGQPIAEEHVSERFNIPLPGEGQTPIVVPGQAEQIAAKRRLTAAKKGQALFSQEDIDDLSHEGSIAAEEATQKLLGPVLEMIRGAKSYEEIGEKIYGLYPSLDSGQFQELLTRAMFAAGLTGSAAVAVETD